MFDWNKRDYIFLSCIGLLIALIIAAVVVCYCKSRRAKLGSCCPNISSTNRYQQHIVQLKTRIKEIEKERDDANSRLSAVIGSRMKENNPNLVDLSDPNRSSKLAEVFTLLYDNEWTDAFEELTKNAYTDTIAIRILLVIVMNAYAILRCEVDDHWKQFEQSIADYEDNVRRLFRQDTIEWRKRNAAYILPHFTQVVMRTLTAGCDDVNLQALLQKHGPVRKYIDTCVKLCLHMVVHEPPLVFECLQWKPGGTFLKQQHDVEADEAGERMTKEEKARDVKSDETCVGLESKREHRNTFDKTLFKEYTTAGNYIQYIVWPAMLLHENGPIMCKGVAQGFQQDAFFEVHL